MARWITLTDAQDHGQGNSPLIINADKVATLAEYARSGGGAGTRIVLDVATATGAVVFVTETIYVVAEKVRGDE